MKLSVLISIGIPDNHKIILDSNGILILTDLLNYQQLEYAVSGLVIINLIYL
jgi:hypothetical protein